MSTTRADKGTRNKFYLLYTYMNNVKKAKKKTLLREGGKEGNLLVRLLVHHSKCVFFYNN